MKCHDIEWFPGDTCLICEHIKADRNQIADHLNKDLEQYIHDRKHFNQTLPTFDMYGPYRDWETDRKSTRLNSSHSRASRMPSSA